MASSVINVFIIVFLLSVAIPSQGHNSPDLVGQLRGINEAGPYLGFLVQSKFQLEYFLGSSHFVPDDCDYVDISARRFHLGWYANYRVVIVVTGSGMLNAGICTQLLITLFWPVGIIFYGRAGNANPYLNMGDIVISRQWAHAGLWHWKRYESGEEIGSYTKDIGYLEFDAYNVPKNSCENSLNKVFFQYEEVFSVKGTVEVAENVFWVNISETYYAAAEKLEEIKLEGCMNSTNCLSNSPKIVRVERGCSSNIYIDNKSYRNFLHSSFNCTPLDEDSAAAALVSWSNGISFISLKSVSNLAGEGSSSSNEYEIYSYVEKENAELVVYELFEALKPEAFPPIEPPVEPPASVEATKFLGHSLS